MIGRRVQASSGPILALGLALLGAGCSMSFPIGPFAEPETTGSIVPSAQVALSPELSGEDLVYAEDAMGQALDPLRRGGAPARWVNPSTGRKGSFSAQGEAFVREEEVCRYFKAAVSRESGDHEDLVGMACRSGGGSWQLRKIRPVGA